jgi:Spy/CpxP family protein refolding chaperone
MTRTRIATAKVAILAAAVAIGVAFAPTTASASPWCGMFHWDINCWR